MARLFHDRAEAGNALAEFVAKLDLIDPVVLALPRGGVPVALPVARRLGAPLDLLMVRKLGMPGQPELAAGAVVEGDPPIAVFNERLVLQAGLTRKDFEAAIGEKTAEIARRRAAYLPGRPQTEVAGRTAVVVDDGIATGATVRAALKGLRARGPAGIVLAVPVAPAETLAELDRHVDETVCLATPSPFYAVGAHYQRFEQVPDAVVIAALRVAEEREEGKE